MNEYDISSIFKDMEEHLLSSMSRNMQRHTNWENDEGFQWEMWQAKQLEALNDYRKQNKKYVNEQSSFVREKIEELLRQSNEHGGMQQEIKILEAIKKGFKPGRTPKGIHGSFFKLNERKLNALIKAVDSDMKKATTAMLRMTNDEYRKTIYKAQVFANTGTMTTDQAIDMATKDFLSKGINCIEYKDGKRVNIVSYAEMAIRTANKRAYLQGEGAKRDEWGIHTVLVSRYGACSETCLPHQGKVYIDNVYSSGTAEEAEKTGYPLLNKAMEGGLFHPNCKHTMSTFFPGISTIPTAKDVEGTRENSNLVATQRYNERMIRKYKRLEKGSLDEQNKAKYTKKVREWQGVQRKLISEHPEMHRNYKRESLRGVNRVDTTADEILSKKDKSVSVNSSAPKIIVQKGAKYEGGIKEKITDFDSYLSKNKYHSEFIKNTFNETRIILDNSLKSAMIYSPKYDCFAINPNHAQFEWYNFNETMTHEIGHRLDNIYIKCYNDKNYSNAIKKTKEYVNNNLDSLQYDLNSLDVLNLHDIFSALTNNETLQLLGGHSKEYWKKENSIEKEIFANMISLKIKNDFEINSFIDKYLSDINKQVERMMEDVKIRGNIKKRS